MRVLAFDPGAERCGYACLEPGPVYVGSGINGVKREKGEKYQDYRLRLIQFWTTNTARLLRSLKPELVVTEIVPAVGGGNFVIATQSQLAAAAATVIQSIAMLNEVPVKQIGATTVKARIGGSNKATKVKVRNGVLELMPEQKVKANEWKTVFDESDAYAIALAHLGYRIKSDANQR